eukprot:189464-Chlamydomonas_euryale.AAC.1
MKDTKVHQRSAKGASKGRQRRIKGAPKAHQRSAKGVSKERQRCIKAGHGLKNKGPIPLGLDARIGWCGPRIGSTPFHWARIERGVG